MDGWAIMKSCSFFTGKYAAGFTLRGMNLSVRKNSGLRWAAPLTLQVRTDGYELERIWLAGWAFLTREIMPADYQRAELVFAVCRCNTVCNLIHLALRVSPSFSFFLLSFPQWCNQTSLSKPLRAFLRAGNQSFHISMSAALAPQGGTWKPREDPWWGNLCHACPYTLDDT